MLWFYHENILDCKGSLRKNWAIDYFVYILRDSPIIAARKNAFTLKLKSCPF